MLGDQPFERGAVYFSRIIKRSHGPYGAKNPRVEQIEFWMADERPFVFSCEYGQAVGKQKVFKDGNKPGDGPLTYLTFTSNVRGVENAPVGKADGFEKARKSSDISDDSFHFHFFIHVDSDIRR